MLKSTLILIALLGGLAIMPGDDIELAQDRPPAPVTVYQHPELDTTTTTVVPEPVRSVKITAQVVWADDRRQPTPPPTTIELLGIMHHCPQWEAEAIRQGWPIDQLDRLDHVMWRESRCDPDAHNTDDPGSGSYGLLQLNAAWCQPNQYWPDGWLQTNGGIDSCDDLFDPAINLRAAVLIWHNSDWNPWRT